MAIIDLNEIIRQGLPGFPGKPRVEYCDTLVKGMYLEVSAANPGQGIYRLRYKDAADKTCHARIGTTAEVTLDAARRQAAALKVQIAAGVNPKATDGKAQKKMLTFDEYYEQHYKVLKAVKRSFNRDEQLYRIRIKDVFGAIPLDLISRQQVRSFHASLLQSGELAPASCDLHLRFLKHAMFLAQDLGLYAGPNPCSRVPMSGVDNRLHDAPDDAGLARLVHVLQTDRNRTVSNIILMLLATGTRLNEALSAKWQDIDIQNRVWRIAAVTSKSGRIRSVPISDSALQILEVQRLETMGKSEFIFVASRSGTRLTTIAKEWRRIRLLADLPKMRCHSTRHWTATSMINSGRTLYEVQQVLGHANSKTTEKYAHLSTAKMLEAANSASLAIQNAMNSPAAKEVKVAA